MKKIILEEAMIRRVGRQDFQRERMSMGWKHPWKEVY